MLNNPSKYKERERTRKFSSFFVPSDFSFFSVISLLYNFQLIVSVLSLI